MKHYQVKSGELVLVDIVREAELTIEEVNESYRFDDYPPEVIFLVQLDDVEG